MGIADVARVTARRSVYADRLGEFADLACGDDAAFARRGRWGEVFARRMGPAFGGRIVLEVGCADAAFVTRIAAKHPAVGFVGLDWKAKAIYDGAARAAGLGLRNALLLRGRAHDLAKIFGPRELDEVWVFHPEPCDRPAELKNRLIAPPFLSDVGAVLRDPASILALKTDHPGYYQWVLRLLGLAEADWSAARTRLRDLARPEDLPPPSGSVRETFDVAMNSANYWQDDAALAHTASRPFAGEVTSYEQRFLKRRAPIYYVELRPRT